LLLTKENYASVERNKGFEDRCNRLMNLVTTMFDHRIDTSNNGDYIKLLENRKKGYLRMNKINKPSQINKFPRGALAEAFFYQACISESIYCSISSGEEDLMGIDFHIKSKRERIPRPFDVSTNINQEVLINKVNEDLYPTVFLLSDIGIKSLLNKKRNSRYRETYAEKYLDTGEFDAYSYLENTLTTNYELCGVLEKYVKNGHIPITRIYNGEIFGIYNFDKRALDEYSDVLNTLNEELGY
jgi:hypothetical protein